MIVTLRCRDNEVNKRGEEFVLRNSSDKVEVAYKSVKYIAGKAANQLIY